jgi:oligopeptide transport system permease protein
MGAFAVKRLLDLIPTMLAIVACCFFLLRAAPGGPFDQEKKLPPEIRAQIEKTYHFDKPLYQQFWHYLGMLARFDLGPSYKYKSRTVNEIIASGFPVSLQLGLLALIFATIIGIGAGVIAAMRQNTWVDYSAMTVAMIGVAIPNFVLGPLLILLFSLTLWLLPPARWESWRHMILPSFSLGLLYAASVARLARGGMLEVLRQDFIRTARAKGLKERVVILRHAVRGGLLPVVSYLGPALSSLMVGSIVVEKIFNVPGIGRYFIEGSINRDYTLVMGVVITYAVFLLFFNFVVDILYGVLDPRVTYD